jgi:hypothetical protein
VSDYRSSITDGDTSEMNWHLLTTLRVMWQAGGHGDLLSKAAGYPLPIWVVTSMYRAVVVLGPASRRRMRRLDQLFWVDYFYLTVRCVKGATTSYIRRGYLLSAIGLIPVSARFECFPPQLSSRVETKQLRSRATSTDTMVLACDACDG